MKYNPKDLRLSNNFWLHEFIVSQDHPELLPEIWKDLTSLHVAKCRNLANQYLQPIRDFFGVALIILSGIRSLALNKKAGGSDSSLHLFLGSDDSAVDFTVREGKELLSRIFLYIRKYLEPYGECIIYLDKKKNPRFLHIASPNSRNYMQNLVNYQNKFWNWDEWKQRFGDPI